MVLYVLPLITHKAFWSTLVVFKMSYINKLEVNLVEAV